MMRKTPSAMAPGLATPARHFKVRREDAELAARLARGFGPPTCPSLFPPLAVSVTGEGREGFVRIRNGPRDPGMAIQRDCGCTWAGGHWAVASAAAARVRLRRYIGTYLLGTYICTPLLRKKLDG